ncbi:MAG: CPBP family intramembrane metalloprotease [Candidatus Brocadiaceae bacterium]
MSSEQKEAPEAQKGYFHESRSFALGIVSILPLIVLYHCGIVQSGYPVRNLAEVWLEGPLRLVGLHAAHVLNVALIIALVAVLLRSDIKGFTGFVTIVIMIAEGGLYALALYKGGAVLTGVIFDRASQVLFAIDLRASGPLLLALGAGVYEELVFRLLLLGGMALLLSKVFLWSRHFSVVVALVISSLLFAAAHHLGPIGEQFDPYSFLFRALSGLLLGVIYLGRGFGVVVWTHAIYNALVVV